MLEEIISENKKNITEKGLKYSVLRHYFNEDDSLLDLGFCTLKDGSKAILTEESKPQINVNLMQNLLYRKLGFTVTDLFPVDLENGKMAMLRGGIAKDKSILSERTLNSMGRALELKDLFSNTLSAHEFHNNYQNKEHIIPLLKDESLFLTEKYFILRQIIKDRTLAPGKRPIDKIFADEFSDFSEFFLDKSLVEILKSRLVKISTFDTKNNLDSLLYKLNGNGLVEKVIPTCSGIKNEDIKKLKFGNGVLKNKYESEFYFGSKGLEKAVKTIRENELLGQIFTQTDRINLTAKLWETSAEELASKYHEDTNYVIDEAYAKNVDINKAIVGEVFRQGNKDVPFIYLGNYYM